MKVFHLPYQLRDRLVMDPHQTEAVSTLRGAAYKLFRFHLHDWLAIFGLAILDVVLNVISPFYRYVGQTMIGDFMYPLKGNTVPVAAVPVNLSYI